ncbi:MAG TPA: MoxR family ATPase [Chloroflexota bacterium]|nr:MoxR family ATPase [Chloroflexota bacterium]
MFESVDAVLDALTAHQYVADRSLATAIFLSLRLKKPLLLEGEAGVGKTEVAKTLAAILGTPLIRVQGYEGIDVNSALYEWNYARQIMAIRSAEASGQNPVDVFGPDFLIKRPILQALEHDGAEPAVLLIDELDRADDEFEAFLLEVLSDFQVSIPEIGTITSDNPPVVVVTSNRTRELHEALKRRCLFHWIGYPDFEKELAIVAVRAKEAEESLRRQVVAFVQELRRVKLYKRPGTSETLDWARALVALGRTEVSESAAGETLGVLLKNEEDMAMITPERTRELVEAAQRVV